MSNRKYSNYSVKNCAILILEDIVKNKISKGWGGNLDELEEMKNYLKNFNVFYTDDMYGSWEQILKSE